MSDSVANLTVKVDTKSVSAAVQALDKLAATAAKVEKSVSAIGSKTTASDAAAEGSKKSERALAAMEKRIDAATRQYEKMIRTINQANLSESQRRNLITDTGNAYLKHLAVIQKINAGTLDLTRSNIAWKNSVSDVKDSVKALETQENRRVATAQKSAKELAAIEKKRVADSLALQTKLEQAQTTIFGVNTRARRQLSPDMAAGVTRQVEADYQRLATALRTYGVGSLEAGKATGEFNRAMKAASSEIARVGGLLPRISDNARTISAAFGAANASVGGFSRAIFNTSAAISALTGAFALREITQSIMQFEQFTNTLKTVSGSTGEFNRNLGFLFSEANRIGFSVGEVGNSFARLSLAMKGAGFSADESKQSFSLLTEASRNFGLSSADTMGVIRALEQSMSKGKFMAEEVRLQLGDRLPIAMAALERAVTKVDGKQADLNKRFEEGSLDVSRYGLEFIRQINALSGGADALSRTSNSIAAALGRLNNELVLVTKTFGEGGFTNAVIIATQNAIKFLQNLREVGVIEKAGAAMELLAKQTDLLTAAFTGLAVALSAGLLMKIARIAISLNAWGRAAAALGALAAAAVGVAFSIDPAQRALNNLTAASNDFNRAFEKAKGVSDDFQSAMRVSNATTRAAVTETQKLMGVYRGLGLSEVELTRIVAQESLKRMDIEKKEMENKRQVAVDAVSVRRNAIITENAEVKRVMDVFNADMTRLMNIEKMPKGMRESFKEEQKVLQEMAGEYASLMRVIGEYINVSIDEKTLIEQLNDMRGKHPNLVDAVKKAVLENADALKKETDVIKILNIALQELEQRRNALASAAARPEEAIAAAQGFFGEATRPSFTEKDFADAKKQADALRESIKQFQDKYGDDRFIAQAKAVEQVLAAAKQSFKDFGIAANLSSEDTLLALAANEAFAKSWPELIHVVQAWAAEIDKARNPLRAQIAAINEQVIQNEKLIAGLREGGSAIVTVEVAMAAHNEALKAGVAGTEAYRRAYDALVASIGYRAEQERKITALRSLENMRNELALIEKEISLLGERADMREEELAATRALQSVSTTDPKILKEIEDVSRAISRRRKALDDAKNGVDAFVASMKVEIQEQEKVIQAYRISRAHVMEAEIAQKAHTEALRFGAYMSAEYTAALEQMLPFLREKADQDRRIAAASSIQGMRDEVALLEKQVSLLGESKEKREEELAVFLARRAAEGGDIEEAERLARRAAELRRTLSGADKPEVAAARNVREEKYVDILRAQAEAQDSIAAAYRISTQAGEERELQLKAEAESIRLAKDGEGEKAEIYEKLLKLLPRLAAGEKNVNAAKDLPRMRDEIALLEKERSLLGQSVSLREQELAAFRARQQLQGRDPAIIAEAERLARDTVKLRQETQHLDNSYRELANIGVRAFEQVGDAITEAFAKGEIRALNFGNVIRGVMSSIIQSILRLGIVNPIINSIFAGTSLPTLGAGLSVMGGAGAAAGGGGGVGIMQMLGLSSLIPKEGIFGSLGLTGPGGLLSTQIFAPYGVGTILEPSIATGAAGLMAPSGGLTLGGFLGAAGLGFGAGTFLNSMLGGNQTGGMVGSGLGSAAGALLAGAGMLGPLGPIAAALIGGLAGGGLGGLFGPKESSNGFGYAIRSQNGLLAMTDMFYNEQGRAQFQEASAKIPAINAYLKQRGLTVSGARAVGGNKYGMGNLGYGEAASFDQALASFQFAATANEELNKALSTRSFAGPEKLQEFVDGFIALQDTIKGLTEDPVPEFKKQMDALIDSFAQAAAKAREYGVNEEELLAARDKAIAKLEEQRNLTLRDMALNLTIRRLTAQGMDQEVERIQMSYNAQKEIESFTASIDALGITAEEKSKLLIALEETQALERAKIIKESTKNIRDYLDSLRTSSELSGTTGMGRLTAAQDIFNRDLAAAQAGDKEAISRITQSADTLLNLARSIYGSTASFYDIRNQVVPGLEGLVNAPPMSGPQSLMNLADVPLVSQVLGARQDAALTESLGYSQRFDEKLAALLPIAEDIRDAVQQANQDLSTSLGSVDFVDYAGPDSSAGGGFGALGGMDSGGGGAGMQAALGAVMKYGRVTAYAYGGIPDFVNSPTMAPMALFGEAGPEAIMPLRRGADGRLGVEVNGNGSQAVVAELRAVRNEIVNLRETVDENDRDQGAALVDVVSDLRIQIGELREELRTTRLRAQ